MSKYWTMGGVTKSCPICGKTFYIPCLNEWAYRRYAKTGDLHFCSWHCLREYEKDHERKTWVTSNQ